MASFRKPDETASRGAWWLRLQGSAAGLRGASLRRAVVGVLAVAVAAQAAHSCWTLWALARAPAGLSGKAVPPIVASTPEPAVAELVSAHLFGRSPDDSVPEASAATAAQFVLTGTLQADTPARGAAILGRTAASTHLRGAGQEVAEGFRLAEVFADHVTLERAGERVSLALPRAIHGWLEPASTRLAAADTAPEARSREERLRERPQNQTHALLELRPSLHRGLGRFDGMRVWGTGDGSNLAAYGLRRNDIIRAVDGEPIENTTAEYRALETLSRGQPVAVTVERGGNVFTLQLGFADPDAGG